MSQENLQIVRTLWATLEREAGLPWPPPRPDEFDRQLRLDLIDEEMEIRNPAEFPVANEYRGHDGVRQWATEVWEVFSELHHELVELIEAGDGETVVSVQRTQGRMRYTGLDADLLWAAVWTIKGWQGAPRSRVHDERGGPESRRPACLAVVAKPPRPRRR